MSTVETSRYDATAVVTINRPDRLNALDEVTRVDLLSCVEALEADSSVAVIVLTGQGRAFCVGQDLEARSELVDADATVRDTYNPLVRLLTTMQTPVIAAVNGPAVGAGMGLALSCDAVLMTEEAFFSCAFSKVGLVPDTGTSLALVRALGHAKAFEAAVSARRIDAVEALEVGLASQLAPAGEALNAALELASSWSRASGHALALTKAIFRRIDQQILMDSLGLEADAQGTAARHPDHVEGVAAFNDRRVAHFGAVLADPSDGTLAVNG